MAASASSRARSAAASASLLGRPMGARGSAASAAYCSSLTCVVSASNFFIRLSKSRAAGTTAGGASGTTAVEPSVIAVAAVS
eukprot:15170486-Heterocapsa_arctica.AAC.1